MVAITFVGIGPVGLSIANRLQQTGKHDVTIAARDPKSKSVTEAVSKNPNLTVVELHRAVRDASVVFLVVQWENVFDAVKSLDLSGKILVDCTNPIDCEILV